MRCPLFDTVSCSSFTNMTNNFNAQYSNHTTSYDSIQLSLNERIFLRIVNAPKIFATRRGRKTRNAGYFYNVSYTVWLDFEKEGGREVNYKFK